MEERRQRLRLFNELLGRTGYLSRDDLAQDLREEFGLTLSGPQISSRLRADRGTPFAEPEFLAMVRAFTCHFRYAGRITAFEALLLWTWSDELPRATLPPLRRIWEEAGEGEEFAAAFALYTRWDLYSGGLDWRDAQTRQAVDRALRGPERENSAAETRPAPAHATALLEQMQGLHAREEFDRLARLYRGHGRQLLPHALAAQPGLFFDLSIAAAHHFRATGDLENAHTALENGTDVAFASMEITPGQRAAIRPFLQTGPDLLKARALLYQSYGCMQEQGALEAGIAPVEEAYGYYRAARHGYGEADALNRMSLLQRKLGHHQQSLWRLSQARDAALRIPTAQDRNEWLTVIRAAECYTAFQFVRDREEPYAAYRALGDAIRSPYARLDYRFTLAVMAYELGDTAAARRIGQAAAQRALALRLAPPFSASRRRWQQIALAHGWPEAG